MTSDEKGHICFDLDGTLALYEEWGDGSVGAPIPQMVARLKGFLAQGVECKIMTARTSGEPEEALLQERLIQYWCLKHLGVILEVTCKKDFKMLALFDDRAFAVEKNTGRLLGGSVHGVDNLLSDEDWVALDYES